MIRHIRDEKWTPSWDTRKGSGDSRKRAAAENRVDICIKDGRKNHTDREEGDTMRIPEHIGIIPDGNRRWAKQAGLAKEAGYAYGLTPGLELLRLARDAGVREITYYGFTTDNCGRPTEQVRAFSAACVQAVERIATEPVSLLYSLLDLPRNFPPGKYLLFPAEQSLRLRLPPSGKVPSLLHCNRLPGIFPYPVHHRQECFP